MKYEIDLDKIGKYKLLGLIGSPVKYSLSAMMHNTVFQNLGYRYLYLPIEVTPKNLPQCILGLRGINFTGINITMPHKEAVVPYLDELNDDARNLGIVNTIRLYRGKLAGYNTDVIGFQRALMEKTDPRKMRAGAVVLGTGASAKSVAAALFKFKVRRITFFGRDPMKLRMHLSRIKYLAEGTEIQGHLLTETDVLEDKIRSAKLIVNATSVGMAPRLEASLITESAWFNSRQIVFDLITKPLKTRLMEVAKAGGAQTINGLEMLAHQAAAAFQLWERKRVPVKQEYKSVLFRLLS